MKEGGIGLSRVQLWPDDAMGIAEMVNCAAGSRGLEGPAAFARASSSKLDRNPPFLGTFANVKRLSHYRQPDAFCTSIVALEQSNCP